MARKFFYVCAGMLMLALSYHFGFSSAQAQAGLFRVLGDYESAVWIETGGQIYRLQQGGWSVPNNGVPPISPTTIVAGNNLQFVAADGTGWVRNVSDLEWVGYPLPGRATSAQRETWGQVKSRYTPNRTAKPGAR